MVQDDGGLEPGEGGFEPLKQENTHDNPRVKDNLCINLVLGNDSVDFLSEQVIEDYEGVEEYDEDRP